MDRLKRVTDLFVEGTELYLGDDDNRKPVVIWVNKLNSFEVEEARRDGLVRRGERIAELGNQQGPEYQGMMAEVGMWSDEELRQNYVNGMANELYLEVLDDLETNPKWREAIDYMRRGPVLHAEEELPDDDPRRKHLQEVSEEYLTAMGEAQQKKIRDKLADLESISRKALEKSYVEQWRDKRSLDEFLTGRRISEIYLSARACDAELVTTEIDGTRIWNHVACDHSEQFFTDRKNVRRAPEQVIARIVDTLTELTATQREAGNSDAPRSSSESLEQSSAPEEVSTPSSPEGQPLAAPTT